jgi:hypothetical protein
MSDTTPDRGRTKAALTVLLAGLAVVQVAALASVTWVTATEAWPDQPGNAFMACLLVVAVAFSQFTCVSLGVDTWRERRSARGVSRLLAVGLLVTCPVVVACGVALSWAQIHRALTHLNAGQVVQLAVTAIYVATLAGAGVLTARPAAEALGLRAGARR